MESIEDSYDTPEPFEQQLRRRQIGSRERQITVLREANQEIRQQPLWQRLRFGALAVRWANQNKITRNQAELTELYAQLNLLRYQTELDDQIDQTHNLDS